MFVTNSSLIPRPETIIGWSPIMGLNANTDLAGLDPTNLGNGFVIGVSLASDDLEFWKLRALATGEVNTANALVVCTADPTRCWVRTL